MFSRTVKARYVIIALIVFLLLFGYGIYLLTTAKDSDAKEAACQRAAIYHQKHPEPTVGMTADDIICQK